MSVDVEYYTNADTLGSRMRGGRFRRFLFPIIERIYRVRGGVRIIDLGGSATYWHLVQNMLDRWYCEITIINNDERYLGDGGLPTFDVRYGDARNTAFPDHSFDLAHSNSVIEHVGRWSDMLQMAMEVRRLAPAYYVQSPYFWFPLEPHFRIPIFHWLPEQIRARLLLRRGWYTWPKASSLTEAMQWVESCRLLDCAQLHELFPDGAILKEKVCGVTKSLVAVREAAR